MGEEKIYFMEGNHPGVVYHGPRSALESRQRRDGGLWVEEPFAACCLLSCSLLNTGRGVVREVDAEGWLIDE